MSMSLFDFVLNSLFMRNAFGVYRNPNENSLNSHLMPNICHF